MWLIDNNGYTFYECDNCDNYHITPFRCKSRFCPTCSSKYREARSLAFSKKAISTTYRHIVFTVPEQLRIFFRINRNLLNLLFKAVNSTFELLSTKDSKTKKKFKNSFGFMASLHTFGRDIKWNPHIHVLVSELTIDKLGIKRKFNYFHYQFLRKTFMRYLLDYMNKEINSRSFYKLKSYLYKEYKNGFYVYAPPIQMNSFKKKKIIKLVNYVTRYAAHPPISESRITELNTEEDTISYYYDPHEDDNLENEDKAGRQYITESVEEFIKKLIIHIPEKGFQTIRYYGFLANKSSIKLEAITTKLFDEWTLRKSKNDLKWRQRLINSYNFDPLKCVCGNTMKVNYELSYSP